MSPPAMLSLRIATSSPASISKLLPFLTSFSDFQPLKLAAPLRPSKVLYSHSADSHSTDSHSTDSHSTDSHSTDSHPTAEICLVSPKTNTLLTICHVPPPPSPSLFAAALTNLTKVQDMVMRTESKLVPPKVGETFIQEIGLTATPDFEPLEEVRCGAGRCEGTSLRQREFVVWHIAPFC